MKQLALLAVISVILGACAWEKQAFSGYDMTLESDGCRSAAVSQVDAPGPVSGERTDRKQADFDQAYSRCMSSKGYQVNTTAP